MSTEIRSTAQLSPGSSKSRSVGAFYTFRKDYISAKKTYNYILDDNEARVTLTVLLATLTESPENGFGARVASITMKTLISTSNGPKKNITPISAATLKFKIQETITLSIFGLWKPDAACQVALCWPQRLHECFLFLLFHEKLKIIWKPIELERFFCNSFPFFLAGPCRALPY